MVFGYDSRREVVRVSAVGQPVRSVSRRPIGGGATVLCAPDGSVVGLEVPAALSDDGDGPAWVAAVARELGDHTAHVVAAAVTGLAEDGKLPSTPLVVSDSPA